MPVYDINGSSLHTDGLSHNFAKWSGKVLVTEGNSLTHATNWGKYLAEYLGMTHVNVALSGSSIVVNPQTGGSTISDIKANVADNYPEKADLIILQGDTNTGMYGEPSDQMDGSDPKTTWTAKMNYMIRCLRAKYHNVIIVLMPDSVRYDCVYGEDSWKGKNVDSYTAMKNLAEYSRLAFFDFDHLTPWNPDYVDNYYNWVGDPEDLHSFELNGMDRVHPSGYSYPREKGRALAEFVAGLVFDPDASNTAADRWSEQYTVTYDLKDGVASSNVETSFWANVIFQTTLSGAATVTVTMGGTDVTNDVYTEGSGLVRIPAVTGDIVITATP